MQAELLLDTLPKPGEPLIPLVHEDNQKILDASIQDRIDRQRSRLTRREQFFLSRRYKRLHKQLNTQRYNPLIVERWQCWQQYEQLKHKLNTCPTRQDWLLYQTVKTQGKILNEKIRHLKPLSTEFDRINSRLKSHRELLAWEHEDRENFNAFLREARTWQAQLEAVFKQSPRLHHRGIDHRGNEFVQIPKIREIIVKDDKVMYHIQTTGQSPIERFFNRWHSALPYGVDVKSLISDETLENLSSACNRVVTVERSKRGTNLFYVISRLDSSDGIPNKINYQKIIDWYPVDDHAKTVWCAGVTHDRKLQWYNFEDIPHILIAGATQGGKSNHVNSMIASLATMNTPQELRMLLIDLKGGVEFTHWRGLQHQLRPMLTTANQVLEGLSWLRSIMEKRLDAFESMKAKNLMAYNDKAKHKLPRIICFVDEMATLVGLGDLTKDIHTELRVLSSQGRAVGVHLVLCTQHSSVEVLPGWIKTNMSMRVSAKMPTSQASLVILDTITASTLPNIPGRMVFSTGRNELIAQSPYISDEQIELAIQRANDFDKPDDTEFTSVLPDPEDKFTKLDAIRVALTHCNGILSATRIFQNIPPDTISDRAIRQLMKQTIREIRESAGIVVDGVLYDIHKERNYYILEVATQSDRQEIDQNLDTPDSTELPNTA